MIALRASAVLALAALVGTGGCAATQYTPTLVARGELTLRYDGGFAMDAGGREVSHGLSWSGLDDYTRCVPVASAKASQAQARGRASYVTAILGGVFGAAALGGFYGLVDNQNGGAWLLAGVGSATVGLVFGVLTQALRNSANGHAVDAMNIYNDAVGSLGATCEDLRYPAPAGPAPPPPPVEANPTGQ